MAGGVSGFPSASDCLRHYLLRNGFTVFSLNRASLSHMAVGIVLTSAIVGVPTSAQATPQQFPAEQIMVFIPCEESPATLYSLDSATGDPVAIGSTPIPSGVCYASAQFNPVSRELVTYDAASNGWLPTTLVRMDLSTGEILGNINLKVDEANDSPDAGFVTLSGLDGYMIDSIVYDEHGNLFVFLDDHKLYYAQPTGSPDTFELQFLIDTPRYALTSAEDPTNPGTIYALFEDNDYSIDNNHFYAFSISYSGNTPVSVTMGGAISSDCRYSCVALTFDESGVAWLENNREDIGLSLSNGMYTTNFESATPAYTPQRAFAWDQYTATFVPTDAVTASTSSSRGTGSGLASTGFDSLSVVGIALAVLAGGLGFARLSRFRKATVK